jgi:hypothetical protein
MSRRLMPSILPGECLCLDPERDTRPNPSIDAASSYGLRAAIDLCRPTDAGRAADTAIAALGGPIADLLNVVGPCLERG